MLLVRFEGPSAFGNLLVSKRFSLPLLRDLEPTFYRRCVLFTNGASRELFAHYLSLLEA